MAPSPKIPSLLRAESPSSLPDPAPAPSYHDRRGWKNTAFDAFAVIFAAGAGYGYSSHFFGGHFWLFVAVAALFLLASFFDFLVTRSPRRRLIVNFLQIVAFLGFFYSVKPSALAGALAVLAVFYAIAWRSATVLYENNLKFRLGPIAASYMKKLFIGFTLAAIVLQLPKWKDGTVFVSQEQFQHWYASAAAGAHWFYSGIDFTASAGAFAENIVRLQLSTNSQFKALPPAAQEQAVRQATQEMLASASKSLGFPLRADASLGEVFYRYLMGLLAHFKDQFGQSFLAVWAVGLFVIVWSIGTVFVWAVVVVAYLIYEFLAAMNVLRTLGEVRTKEVVELA